MGSKSSAGCAILLAVVVLLLVCLAGHLGEARRHLAGFWAGDPEFLQEAGLEDMFLFVAPARGSLFGKSTHDAFLLMATPDGLICNQQVTLAVRLGHNWRRKEMYSGRAKIAFSDPDQAPEVMLDAEKMTLAVEPGAGVMTLTSDDTVLGSFYKDAAATVAADLVREV